MEKGEDEEISPLSSPLRIFLRKRQENQKLYRNLENPYKSMVL